MWDVFAVYMPDVIGAGTIGAKDVGTAWRLLGQKPTEAELEDLVNEVEVGSQGSIDFIEFLRVLTNKKSVAGLDRPDSKTARTHARTHARTRTRLHMHSCTQMRTRDDNKVDQVGTDITD